MENYRIGFPLRKELGPQILSHLGDLARLPDSGFLAGQAVSSAVFDLFIPDGDQLSVYNDLDIFRPAIQDDHNAVLEQQRELDTVKFQQFEIERHSGHLRMAISRSYDVVRSYRDGLINQVVYENLYGSSFTPSPLQTLLSGFDLNCTQIGVDLETGFLEWTPAFQQFLTTRQLEICNVQTPYHTAMRWFKKRCDLPGCYGDDQSAMELIALLSYVKGPNAEIRHYERDYLRWRFGSKSASLFPQHERQLSTYFELEPQSDKIYLLNPRGAPDTRLMELGRKYPLRSLAHVYNEFRRPRKKSKKERVQFILSSGCRSEHFLVPLGLGSYLKQGDSYLAGNWETKQLAAVNAFCEQHPELMLHLLDEPARAQIRYQQGWEHLERRFGSWIYDYVEMLALRYGRFYRREDPYDIEDLFENELTHQMADNAKLVKHKPIIKQIGDFTVQELITRAELIEEGNELHHCVGGYASEVFEERSRIFSIASSDRNQRSTLEIVRTGDRHDHDWEIAQHFSYCNSPPSDEAHEIAEAFFSYFSLWAKRKAKLNKALNFLANFGLAALTVFSRRRETEPEKSQSDRSIHAS